MKNSTRLWLSLIVIITLSNFVSAQTSLGSSKTFMRNLKKELVQHDKTVLLQVENSKTFKAKINFRESNASSEFLIGEIKNVPESSFYIKVKNKSLEGHIIFKKAKEAYKYYSDAKGNAYITKEDINKLICLDYRKAPQNAAKATSNTVAEISPALLNLQSLPGAPGCVLLDLDGYYMPAGNLWNNGNAILAAPSGMSDADALQLWELVSEDYRAFNLNITTSEEVFNTYPKNRRMRTVVTPTDIAAPGRGGVSYIGSFNWDNDVPSWVFELTGKYGGESASHEIGHTFDLSHDGIINGADQFVGIPGTSWAPIMGAGYYRPVTQWSKGEYNNANNKEDDVAIIASSKFGIGYRPDDYGNTLPSATTIEYDINGIIKEKKGVITSVGVIPGATDWDVFMFNTSGGNVSIDVKTVARDGDIHLVMVLYDSNGTTISVNTNPDPFVLDASLNVNVPAGKYFLRVEGGGAGNPANGGYSRYGSIGSYSITGIIPPINPSKDVITVYNDCDYTGFSGGLTIGDYNLARLNSLGVSNDDISSLRVAEGFQAILYQDDNFTGASTVVTSDNSCLDATWNNTVTSVRILANGVTNLGDSTFYLRNRNSNLDMSVWGASTADGANIAQWTPESGTNQKFTFTHLGDGLYKIIANNSGKSLDVSGSSKDNGANVIQHQYFGTANQQFIVVAAGDGFYKIIARHSGKLLDVAEGSTANGANVQQWENNNQTWGQWKLVPPVSPSTDVITVYSDCDYTGFSGGLTIGDYTLASLNSLGILNNDISSLRVAEGFKVTLYQDDNFTGASTIVTSDNGCLDAAWNNKVTSIRIRANGDPDLGNVTYSLQNRNSNLYMSVKDASTAQLANIVQSTSVLGKHQRFTLTHLGDGIYKIVALHSDQALDVYDASKANGANIVQYPYYGAAHEQFILVYTDDGYYKIIARHSGKLVDVAGASTADGANVQQWENNNQAWGQWRLIPTTPEPPSTLIQAEHYSAMQGIQTETTTDTDGGLNVGHTDKGDWMTYNNINFPTSGSYVIEYRVASAVNGARISSDLNGGTTQLGKVKIPNIGGWQKWQTVSQTVNVNAGTYNFGIFIRKSGVNINWIRITKTGTEVPITPSATEDEETDAASLDIYPNPVENTLFTTTDLTGGNISIVDSQTGAVISGQKINNKSIDVSQLRRGVYLLVFEKDGTRTVERFIKK